MKFYCQFIGILLLFLVGLSLECGQRNLKKASTKVQCRKSNQRPEWVPLPPVRKRVKRQAIRPGFDVTGFLPHSPGFPWPMPWGYFTSIHTGSESIRLDLPLQIELERKRIADFVERKRIAALLAGQTGRAMGDEEDDEDPKVGPRPQAEPISVSVPIIPDNYDDRYRDHGPHVSYIPHLLKDAASEFAEPDFSDKIYNIKKGPEMHEFYASGTAPSPEVPPINNQQEILTTLRPVDPSYAGRSSADDEDVNTEAETEISNQVDTPNELEEKPIEPTAKPETEYKYPSFQYPARPPAIPYPEPIISPFPIRARPHHVYHGPQYLQPRKFHGYKTPKFNPHPASLRYRNKSYTNPPHYYSNRRFRY